MNTVIKKAGLIIIYCYSQIQSSLSKLDYALREKNYTLLTVNSIKLGALMALLLALSTYLSYLVLGMAVELLLMLQDMY